jgi:SAM-dependent methyltransferase
MRSAASCDSLAEPTVYDSARVVNSNGERQRLRRMFDAAAAHYQRVRPDYPEELLGALIEAADLVPGDHLLEVGCATGKATVPLALKGFRITCIELGSALAAEARRNLEEFPEVEIVEGSFEEWTLPEEELFDLVYAATAWHWVDPDVRYLRAWDALKPGGHLAFWAAHHVFPQHGDVFFREIQEVYDEIGEGLPAEASWPRPGELDDDAAEIEASGLFEVTLIRHFDWERSYNAEEYIELLETFSGHLAMVRWKKDRLYGEMRRRLANRPDKSVRRHWGTVLHVAQRRDIPAS